MEISSFIKMWRFYSVVVSCILVVAVSSRNLTPLDGTADEEWSVTSDGSGNLHVISKRDLNIEPIFFDPEKETKFFLYTREDPENKQTVVLEDAASLQQSRFDPSRPTRFVIHGWINDYESPINDYVRPAYLRAGNFNVFVVDWGEGSYSEYAIAKNRVDDVGRVVARFIDFLHSSGGASFSTINVAGHSLGAHVGGFACKYVTQGRIPVLFALDPALPLFYWEEPEDRVSSTDAVYVESIQTNAGILGFDRPIGQAAFYPNYGTLQPKCEPTLCSHEKAHKYFAESLYTTVGFYAEKCESWWEIVWFNRCTKIGTTALMGGEPARTNRSGVYYLPTNVDSPFAKGSF